MFKKKCFICGLKDEKSNMRVYVAGNHEFSYMYYYHKDCLKVASCNAKEYSSSQLSLIIDIVNIIKRKKAKRAGLLINCNKICNELKETEAIKKIIKIAKVVKEVKDEIKQ